MSRLDKGEQIVTDAIMLDSLSIWTICDNADWIKESAKSKTKVFE
jgi:hypothetical protein